MGFKSKDVDERQIEVPTGSVMSSLSSQDSEPLPGALERGGAKWLQVLASFLLCFSSSGLTVGFGQWQEYLGGSYLAGYSESDIAWIGTVQGFVMVVVGVLAGPAYDLGLLRPLVAVGGALAVAGFVAAGSAATFAETLLSLGFCVGLGAGCFYTPSLAHVAGCFPAKRRSLALGVAASGGSVGGVVIPILLRSLTTKVGYLWANRAVGLVLLVHLLAAFGLLKPSQGVPPGRPTSRRRLLDRSALADAPYLLFTLGLLSVWTGLYLPFFYVPLYARQVLGVSSDVSAYLLASISAGSFFGRVLVNTLAGRLGARPLTLANTCLLAVLAFTWAAVRDLAGAVAFGLVYGFFAGAAVSLPPVLLAEITSDLRIVGTRMGMSLGVSSLGMLVGSPIGGVLMELGRGFLPLQMFCGATITCGCALYLVATKIHHSGGVGKDVI